MKAVPIQPAELRLVTARIVASSAVESSAGTAFFVQPGLLLTCAHVVTDTQGVRFGAVTVQWPGAPGDANGTVLEIRRDEAGDARFPFPDLALIHIDLSKYPQMAAHPSAPLTTDIRPGDSAYVYGYSGLNYFGEPVPLHIDGMFPVTGMGRDSEAIKLSGGLVLSGISGAPVLSERTGMICGIIKRTRSETLDLGGYAISVQTILNCFPQLSETSAPAAPDLDAMLESFAEPPLSAAQKESLVRALLACSKLQTASGRAQIVNDLPMEIRLNIPELAAPTDHVLAIVSACLQYPGGLAALFDRLAFFEAGKIAHNRLLETAAALYAAREGGS